MEQGEDLAGEAYQRRKDPRAGENDAGEGFRERRETSK